MLLNWITSFSKSLTGLGRIGISIAFFVVSSTQIKFRATSVSGSVFSISKLDNNIDKNDKNIRVLFEREKIQEGNCVSE